MTFLWGASTSPHQTEGDNVNSDWWEFETVAPGMQPSGDALDSYHRYPEDMRLLTDAGLSAYRFGVEWARIEPLPGQFSRAALDHYRSMIDTAVGLGLTPVITLHHFSSRAGSAGSTTGPSNGSPPTRPGSATSSTVSSGWPPSTSPTYSR